jgi:hypothetical protein
MEGKFASDGLQAIKDDNMLTATARETRRAGVI